MQLSETETEELNKMYDLIRLAVNEALAEAGVTKKYLSLREAKEKFGAGKVKCWISAGLIHPKQDGPRNSKMRIDSTELKGAAMLSNRAEYYEAQRKK